MMTDDRREPIGTQRVANGKTWTMARYEVAMWVPTDDAADAQRQLVALIEEKLGPIYQNLDPERLRRITPGKR